MRKYIDDSFRRFLHGADYNPEQWLPDKTVWDEDMRLFSLAGMNEMSVGIFAWSKLGIEGTLGGTSPLPDGVSAHERADGEDRYIFIGNYTSEEKTVDLGTAIPATDLETREPVTERKLTLPPFGCRILKKKD